MPKVSVVMPVFNGEQYIGESIASVLAQRSTDLELIVVNDGSTDKSLEIAKAFAEADARVRVINRPNSGRPSVPKNDGLAVARGEYVCFQDHDDLYDADRTCQLVEGLDRHPDWVAAFHDIRLFDSEGGNWPGSYLSNANFLERASPYLTPLADDWFDCSDSFFIYQSLVTGAFITQAVLIAPNRLAAGMLRFDTQFTLSDDTDLAIRLGLQGKMGYLNRVLSSYRQHENNMTRNREKFMLDAVRLHKHNFQRVEKRLLPSQLLQLRARIAACLMDVGYVQYQQYRLLDARAAYLEALSWSRNREAVVGYMKTFIPISMLRGIKGVMNH